jgi:hypothetical protein
LYSKRFYRLSHSPNNKRAIRYIVGILIAAAIISLFAFTGLPDDKLYVVLPVLMAIVLFLLFFIILQTKIGNSFFGELGFVYLALAMAYTIFPASIFLLLDLSEVSGWMKLARLLPKPFELGVHLWRHCIFIFSVAVGYLLFRGNKTIILSAKKDFKNRHGLLISFLMGMICLCIFSLSLLSAPVDTYVDHYTRYEHLSWLSLHFVYLCLILKTGGYFVLLTLLFSAYKRYRMLLFIVVPAICLYETTYSLGSRIETLTIILAVVCLYHYRVRTITLKAGFISFIAIAVLFSAIESIRSSNFMGDASPSQSSERALPAIEFGAVYFTGFHLYEERNKNALPPREWPMLLYDFFALVPFIDHTQWNSMYWYARNYFPDAVVPPETIGPIADSAIWGGEFDLVLRGLINGAFFAFVVRWFLRHKDRWWGVVIYVYCYATCVMTLKYSIFYLFTPLIRILVPTLFFVWIIKRLIPSKSMLMTEKPRDLRGPVSGRAIL